MADYSFIPVKTTDIPEEGAMTAVKEFLVNTETEQTRVILKEDVRFPASQITNDSGVTGATAKDALNTLNTLITAQVEALDSAKVDKVTGKSLVLDTEISRLASVTNQTLSGLGGEAASNKTQTITNSETDYPSGKAVTEVIIPSEQVASESLSSLNSRIEALETIIANSQYSKIDVLDEFNFFGKTNLILFGVTSPSITPDFIGQFYINTTAGITYQSKGVTNSGDWKQTSN